MGMTSVAIVKSLCLAISRPRSQVNERDAAAGNRRDVWVGPKPAERDYRRAVVIDAGPKNKTNADTFRSEWKTALKKTFDGADVVRDGRLAVPAQTVDATLACSLLAGV